MAWGKALDKQEKLILTFTEADKKVGKCFGLFIDLLRQRRGRSGMAMATTSSTSKLIGESLDDLGFSTHFQTQKKVKRNGMVMVTLAFYLSTFLPFSLEGKGEGGMVMSQHQFPQG